jgi:preprotein translocase subunit SecF
MNIIGHRRIYLSIAGCLVALALVSLFGYGLKQGIDFQGGTLWSFTLGDNGPSVADVRGFFTDKLGAGDAVISRDEASGTYLAKLGALTEEQRTSFTEQLVAQYPDFAEVSYSSIGPSVGAELRNKSITALLFVLLGISLYIAFAFRKVYRPVSSWKYGIVTLITLFHDVSIPTGLLAYLGHSAGVEIDGNFVVALLVIMGFSVHDTIVVFDRIRENLFHNRSQKSFEMVVNDSVNQTMARSINTSFTLILVLLVLFFAGPATLHYFILTLLVGVTLGVYSSIFVASPLLLVWHNLSGGAKGKKA